MASESRTTSSTSTPRKRSKWDEEDPDDAAIRQLQQPSKRTVRTRPLRGARPPSPVRSELHPATSRLLQPLHSIYVPPRTHHPSIQPSRSVYCYERLNQIEEGSYGVVFRARDKETGDIVALKKLKLDEEKHGFPITALREINALMSCRHDNVVRIREVVVGDTLTQ
jgi:cell division cycle 2-like protein